jgi:hypothetical protein
MKTLRHHPLLVVCAFFLARGVAHATPNFPPAIQSHLSLAAAPDCSLCHTDGDQGGKGTANTPFALNMKSRGLAEFDVDSLNAALDKMAADHVDSAGDCLDDIDELKAGHDPNLPDPPGSCADAGVDASAPPPSVTAPPETPTYGCVGRVATRNSNDDSFLVFAVAAGVALARRRRRVLNSSRR